MISLLLQILLAWLTISFLATAWLALAGYRIHRKQESQRFASDGPLIYYDAQPHEYRRLP